MLFADQGDKPPSCPLSRGPLQHEFRESGKAELQHSSLSVFQHISFKQACPAGGDVVADHMLDRTSAYSGDGANLGDYGDDSLFFGRKRVPTRMAKVEHFLMPPDQTDGGMRSGDPINSFTAPPDSERPTRLDHRSSSRSKEVTRSQRVRSPKVAARVSNPRAEKRPLATMASGTPVTSLRFWLA